MSRHGEITLPFAGEERVFRLGLGEWRKVQERCDAGPMELLARLEPMVRGVQAKLNMGQMLAAGIVSRFRWDDLREPLFQGLRGGGMSDIEATVLLRQNFDDALSFEHVVTAFLIVEASVLPPADEPLGEKTATTGQLRRRSRKAKSGSPTTSVSPAL